MRITSPLLAVVVGFTLSMAGCGPGTPAPEQEPAPESVTTDEQRTEGDVTQLAMCPLRWTCDATSRYYLNLEQCTAACGSSACYRDHACTGGCTCP
ncbi:hypothetical protein ACLESO_33685 [Pyxidicoccus sp. 3LG]